MLPAVLRYCTRFTSLSLCLLLLACEAPATVGGDAGSPDAATHDAGTDGGPIVIGDPLTWAHGEPGPFRVGYRSWERTYTPRGRTEARTIRVHVWYPTLDVTGPSPRYTSIYLDRNALEGAAPAMPAHASGRYPVHVFSHGFRGFGGVAHFLHRHLASHGWVIVAPDHTGNTLIDHRDPLPVWHYYVRSLDVVEALDALDDLAADDPLRERADTARALLSGHSFGTHTTWASAGATFDGASVRARCTTETPCTDEELAVFDAGVGDARFVAAIPMAGAIRSEWFGEGGHSSVTIPMLAMSGGADPVGADVQFARVVGLDFTWIDIADACHEFFGLGCGDPPGEQARVVGSYVLAMGRRYVLSDTGPATTGILDGTITVSPRVTLERR